MGGIITGVITAADTGAFLLGASISVINWENGYTEQEYANMDGVYQTRGLPEGVYILHFDDWSNPRYIGEYYDSQWEYDNPQAITITGSSVLPNINADLDRGGSVSGFVNNARTGFSIQSANIQVYEAETGGYIAGYLSNPWGHYQIPGVPPGEYKAYFQSSGYWPQYYQDTLLFNEAVSVTIRLLEDTPGIDANLRPIIKYFMPLLMISE